MPNECKRHRGGGYRTECDSASVEHDWAFHTSSDCFGTDARWTTCQLSYHNAVRGEHHSMGRRHVELNCGRGELLVHVFGNTEAFTVDVPLSYLRHRHNGLNWVCSPAKHPSLFRCLLQPSATCNR